MALIPTVSETDEQRRYRVLSNQVETLTEQVRELQTREEKPIAEQMDERAEVPKVIQFAAETMRIMEERLAPDVRRHGISGDLETIGRTPTKNELECLDSACHLLQFYFDKHNGYLADKKAETKERQLLRQKALEDQQQGNTEAKVAKTEPAQQERKRRGKDEK